MITTFLGPEGPETVATRLGRRRPAVARACADCQRRKVKCNGQLPCYNCRVGHVPCQYVERRRRADRQGFVPSEAEDYAAIFKRLFGQIPSSAVRDCSRDRLLNLLINPNGEGSAQNSPTTGLNTEPMVQTPSTSPTVYEAVQRLQTLEDGAAERFEWDESVPGLQDAGADDVNALSLSAHSRSSFLGISSVAAVVRVLVKVLPGSIQHEKEARPTRAPEAGPAALPAFPSAVPGSAPQLSYHEGQRLIDAYFSQVHIFAPMVHEPTFRNQYLSRNRRDSPWMALLYMVLALGSVASSTSDSEEDIVYYRAAQAHLGLESFGSGQMETLQALILMGGLYLHYRNRPNMASAIMGATNRIACGLGLHREFHGGVAQGLAETEVRRRTWWSNYVVDIWGSITLGRPYHAAKFDVKPPRNLIDDQAGEAAANEPTIHSPLIHNIALCDIMGQIQSRLHMSPILERKEIAAYDKMLVDWYRQLPAYMQPPNPCPASLQVVRAVFTWRYQNIRILLHRAVVLDATIRQILFAGLEAEEQKVVAQCRQLAAESILSIKSEWRPTKMSGWNGVWFLFQACLVPLMALATEAPEDPDSPNWRAQVQTGIALCNDMAPWSLVGGKTKAVLEQLLRGTERVCQGDASADPCTADLDALPYQLNQSFFGGDWSDVMGGEDYPVTFDQSFLDSAAHFLDADISVNGGQGKERSSGGCLTLAFTPASQPMVER
ncbi:Fungal specific transcription factor domain-containing protein [Pleurostoma richardsiae]|uniref:Fungal specific transcription factor domain-containing protein n=1 Tax=Pleurostoma richardsiae TaxID=41990 RepID=A0AA38VII1_9PEZI|nr:Fungal specific transcription factor domain-containing protein [Pleurostoma richardsiae]